MQTIYSTCDRCGKEIKIGEAHMSITREEETAKYILASDDYSIKTIDAVQFLTFCGSCGNATNTDSLKNIIKSIPHEEKKEIKSESINGKEWISCDRCDKSISFGERYFMINRSIESAELSTKTNEIYTNVIDSMQIVGLCHSCGKEFTTKNLQKLILNIPPLRQGSKNTN